MRELGEAEEAGGIGWAQSMEALIILGRNWVCSCGQSGVPSEAWEDPSGGMESRWEEEEWIQRLVKKPSWYVREVKSTCWQW